MAANVIQAGVIQSLNLNLAPPAPPVPHLLPADVPGFTGRRGILADLSRLASTGPVAVVLSGTAGVGKTALAVHWGHSVRELFPDGQIHVNLRGFDPLLEPMSPADALDFLLRALGMPGDTIPAALDSRIAAYRGLLDGRRVLVVLDNARDPQQVRPLLPQSPGTFTLVTSRDDLAGLVARDGAVRRRVDLLDPAESRELLVGVLGEEQETPALDHLARLCARLPLALRIAAERAARRGTSPEDLARELAAEAGRLDLLDAGSDPYTAVRTVFSWSYRLLAPETARLFRLLGEHAGPDIGTPAAAALAGLAEGRAARLLEALADTHLVEGGADGRWRTHDLLRAYARELALAEETAVDRRAALSRVSGWYLAGAAAAAGLVAPHRRALSPVLAPGPEFSTDDAAAAWLEAERINLVESVRRAEDLTYAWTLPAILWRYFSMRGYVDDWRETHRVALSAAGALGEEAGAAIIHTNLGLLDWRLGRTDDALGHHRAALAAAEAAGSAAGEAVALVNLGIVYERLGRRDEALTFYTRAEGKGDDYTEARRLTSIGVAREHRDEPAEALSWYELALPLMRASGDAYGEAALLTNIGNVLRRLGDLTGALDHQERALPLLRRANDSGGEAEVLNDMAETCRAAGLPGRALELHTAALPLARQAHERHEEARAHDGIAALLQASGDPAAAARHWRRALELFEALGSPEAARLRALPIPAPRPETPAG